MIAQGRKSEVIDEDLKDSSDEEDEKKEEIQLDDDEDEIPDDYFLDFVCETEILRAKKASLQKKISKVQWSA